jgi:hypothetical protein
MRWRKADTIDSMLVQDLDDPPLMLAPGLDLAAVDDRRRDAELLRPLEAARRRNVGDDDDRIRRNRPVLHGLDERDHVAASSRDEDSHPPPSRHR